MFDTLLVANRGEIAVRVFRTAARLGITTVALFTEADADAPHVREADKALPVDSYLDIDAVVAAAKEAGAQAIHPGYGFLSERAAFARAVADAGLTLVGPKPAVMDAMGRKDAAREIAIAAGVPVVPSYDLGQDPATFAYPVLVKAAAGGGGKGMRVVSSVDEFDEAVAAAKREAASAFGDDTMLIEKYVERGRHIEVQVMADAHGSAVHLLERDCSSQRRHQKVIEEAPAPELPAKVRELVTGSAVALAEQVGYTNAGTVEFLLDAATLGTNEPGCYFLEMNTRLQVEHPVTESVARVHGRPVDLVELQLRIAAGEPLGFTQDDVTCEGHALEARVYAEDAFGGFLPQAGTAELVHWPATARVDHALESGQVVSTSYDPMLGKVIVHAADRSAAIAGLVAALDDTAILGLTTNTGYLRALASTPEFAAVEVDTAWLDHHELPAPTEQDARAFAAVALDAELRKGPPSAWSADRFRLGGTTGPLVEHGRRLHEGPLSGTVATLDDGLVLVEIEGDSAFVRRTLAGTEVVHHGQRFVLDNPDPFRDLGAGAGDGALTAPMPGTVLAVNVAAGDQVEEGQTLGVLEAMKMELAIKAPFAGTVEDVAVAVADQVALGATLFTVAPVDARADTRGAAHA